MNIAGKNNRLIDLTRDLLDAEGRLVAEAMKYLKSERSRFALRVLLADQPIRYLESVVRNEINTNLTKPLKK